VASAIQSKFVSIAMMAIHRHATVNLSIVSILAKINY